MEQAVRRVQRWLDERFAGRGDVRILEAGCGSASMLDLPAGRRAGLDVSEAQLARNERLDEKLLGDLQSFDLGEARFDLVVCWDVLEHVASPPRAMRNLARALAPGGLLLIKTPNPGSLKGLLTRLTPYAFHRWSYRRMLGYSPEAMAAAGPFPTLMQPSMSPNALGRSARRLGLRVEHFELYESEQVQLFKRQHRLAGGAWRLLEGLGRLLTRGRWNPSLSDCVLGLGRGEK